MKARGAGLGDAYQQTYATPVVCHFYDKDGIPNPFSDKNEPLVIARDFSSLALDPPSASHVLPNALAMDRAHLLRYIDCVIKTSVDNDLLWVIVSVLCPLSAGLLTLILAKKGVVAAALRCATGLAILFNMEKNVICEAANINLYESQDLVAATVLSVAYEIRDQLATLHKGVMDSYSIDSKDQVAVSCALELLWAASEHPYKSEIPALVSAVPFFAR